MLVEVLSVAQSTLRLVVISALNSWPSSLAVPNLGLLVRTTSNLLNMCNGLVHIVKVDVGGILAGRALPEGEGVDHDDIGGTNDGVASAVGKLVPGVRGADLDALRQLALDNADLLLQLRASEVAAVQGLGADSDSVDRVSVGAGDVGDGLEVLLERVLNVRPTDVSVYCYHNSRSKIGPYQIPSTTLKPLLFAAGKMFLAKSQSDAAYPRTILAPEADEMASKSSS